MRTPRVYHPELHVGEVELSVEESQHLAGSLRVKVGTAVVLFDGRGQEATGRVTQVRRRGVAVEIGAITSRPFELRHRITLAVAMAKQHRQGFLIEKCTELGVAAIWPMLTGRSVTRPSCAAVEKWRRRAIEAAKQSARAWVPEIVAARTLEEIAAGADAFDVRCLADTGDAARPFHVVLGATADGGAVLVFVGPEGGWTYTERARLGAAGAVPVSLGPTVLRTETAAVAVCAAAAGLSGPGSATIPP